MDAAVTEGKNPRRATTVPAREDPTPMSNQTPYPISVAFTAENIKKSIKFYREKLGFTLAETFPNEKKPMWANLVLAGQSVMLGQAMSPKDMKKMCADNKKAAEYWAEHAKRFQKVAHGVGVCVYLHVPDVDGYQKQLKGKRIKADLPPTTQFYGLREMVVADPDGFTLVFYSHVQAEKPPACCEASDPCATAVEPSVEVAANDD